MPGTSKATHQPGDRAAGCAETILTAMPSHERGTAKTLHELPDIDMEAIRQIIEAAAIEHALGGDLRLCTDLAAKKVQAMISGSSK